ncbi:MAG: NusG domain II-containing protein [Spirochaetia bacterium]|jgi:hypothetical protein|nr:NusG domain II-containing protein [Spirochaetia bacterium]
MIKLKIADIAVIVLSLAAAVTAGFYIYDGYKAPELLEITAASGKSVYQLDQDRKLIINGPLGDSVIIIKEKEAWFLDSPCPDKLCVKTGHINDSGEWAGCLPNRVFIRITGKGEDDEKIDAVSF